VYIYIYIYIYIYYRQTQQSLLVSSVDATCFDRVENPQALKYMTLKHR